jgi:septum formation protein
VTDRHFPTLILASTSPRRRELLSQAGFDFKVISPGDSGVDETPLNGESAQEYVARLARAKAQAGWNSMILNGESEDNLVLGADTTVTIDDLILEKPIDDTDAYRMLNLLSGRTHSVLTGLCLRSSDHEESIVSISKVHFETLTNGQMTDYISSGEPFDKAGAYGIQGRGALFIKHLEGSYSGVMGLPLYELGQLMKRFEST